MKQSYKVERIIKDQAESLRRIGLSKQNMQRKHRPQSVSRVISFTSGKGGVGKTSLVINTAIGLAREGKSVLILDADLGLANVDVMLGVKPRYTLQDLFEGRKTLDEIVVSGPEGISIIPAASGVESICNLDMTRRMMLMEAVEGLAISYDYILIDTPAGIGPDVIYFNTAASEIVCVINPEPTSLTDAYALLKVLSQDHGEKSISIISNEVLDEKEGSRTYQRLQKAVERFLHIELNYLGYVPSDSALPEAVRSQKAMLELFPSSPAGLAVSRLAKKIDTDFHEFRVKGGMQFFFRQLLDYSAGDGQ